MSNESNIRNYVLNRLYPYFDIATEVRGRHFSGQTLRIDAVLTSKKPSTWKTPVPIGIEFKDALRLTSTKDITHWVSQCLDYSATDFEGFGFINIFACPGLIEDMRSDYLELGFTFLIHLLSNHGIGELRHHDYFGWTFYMQSTHRIWSEKTGIAEGKRWDLTRKFGSR